MCKCNKNEGHCQCASPKNGACCTCTPKLDLNKPVQTSQGMPARIVCKDSKTVGKLSEFCILALVEDKEGTEFPRWFNMHGEAQYTTYPNLVNVPERIKGWVNVYKANLHPTKEKAERASRFSNTRLKTIYVDVEK